MYKNNLHLSSLKYIVQCWIYLAVFSSAVYAHEQWFFSEQEMITIQNLSRPLLFTQIGFFNLSLVVSTLVFIIFWVGLDKSTRSTSQVNFSVRWSVFILRITTGLMLFFSSFGWLPEVDSNQYQPTLLVPDLVISWDWLGLRGVEFILSLLLIIGLFTRWVAFLLIVLLLFAWYLLGLPLLQFFGFYLGIFIFLMREGARSNSNEVLPLKNQQRERHSIIILQTLTGLNFLYSAISVKFIHPNLDMVLLQKTQAFTFGIPYDYFTFLMFVVEAAVGILFLTGAKLHLVSLFLIVLFTFLSINLSENIFLHLFIYGILFSFIFLKGINVFRPTTSFLPAKNK